MKKNTKELEAEIASLEAALLNKTNETFELREELAQCKKAFNKEVHKHDSAKEDLYQAKRRIEGLEDTLNADKQIEVIEELKLQLKSAKDIAEAEKKHRKLDYEAGFAAGTRVGEGHRAQLEAGIRQMKLDLDDAKRMNHDTNQLNLMILTKHGEWMEAQTRQKMIEARQAEIQKLLALPVATVK